MAFSLVFSDNKDLVFNKQRLVLFGYDCTIDHFFETHDEDEPR